MNAQFKNKAFGTLGGESEPAKDELSERELEKASGGVPPSPPGPVPIPYPNTGGSKT